MIKLYIYIDWQLALTFASFVCVCSPIACPTGKPVNLSTNCAKHVLVELKHAHVEDVGSSVVVNDTFKQSQRVRARFPDKSILEPVKPPEWHPSLLLDMISTTDSAIMEDEEENDDDDIMHLLRDAEETVARLDAPQNCPNTRDTIGQFRSSIQKMLCNDASDAPGRKRKKAARGNSGYFEHLTEIRTLCPKRPNEEHSAYLKRLHAQARESWIEAGSVGGW